MSRRVNPIILLGLIVVLILSLGILATAQSGGGTASDAIGIGEAQVGKPFRQASDGPDAFSCAGLIRYIMRTAGVDPNASFSPEGYLGAYPSVAGDPQPGDLMIFPNHATIYVGGGMVLNANEVEGMVTHTPISVLGTPLGIVRPPYGGGGGGQPPAEKSDPIATGNPTTGDNTGAILPADNTGAILPTDNMVVPPADNTAIPPADNIGAIPPADNTAIPPADNIGAIPPADNIGAIPPTTM